MYKLLLLFLTIPAWASNSVKIQLDELNYKDPKGQGGEAGNLVFSKVRMSWDGMKVNLYNKSAFLDATIKVRHNYIQFKTSGVGITLPLATDSAFFKVDSVKLKNSDVILNEDFFSFNGEYFRVSDGISQFSLDKFNVYCNGPKGIDMTGVDGMIHGCLSELILNGQNEGDLAGAQIEYFDNPEKEDGIHLKSRLKDFRLKDSKFMLNLNQADLSVANFKVNVGEAKFNCKKEEELFELDVDRLRNGCVNEANINAPEISVEDTESKSKYRVNLKELKTGYEFFDAKMEKVDLEGADGKVTSLKNLEIDCFRNQNDEFYDLHKVISGCVERATIKSSKVTNGTKDLIRNLEVTINDNKATLFLLMKVPYLPQFKVEIEAHVEHDFEAKTLSFDVIRYRAMKVFTLRPFLRAIMRYVVSGIDNMVVKDKKLKIQL